MLIPFKITRNSIEPSRRWETPFFGLQKEMNRLMDSFFQDWPEASLAQTNAFSPHLDISETEKSYLVDVELPGVDPKDVDLSFNQNTLTIRGEKRGVHEEKDANAHRTERTFGSFVRAIPFYFEIDENKIEARYDKGVLHISLPKLDAAKNAKKIEIK